MDRLEFFALVPNAIGNPGLEELGALSFRFGLEVVGTAVFGQMSHISGEASDWSVLHRPWIRLHLPSAYHQQSRSVSFRGLVFPAGPPWRCTVAAPEPFICWILLTRLSVSESCLSRRGRLLPGIS